MKHLLYIVWRIGQGRHRRSVRFIRFPPNKKCPCSPKGNKDRKNISAVPPCLPEIRPLTPVPTHRLPRNAGNASKDTPGFPVSPCPRRPICCPAFRSALSCAKLSVDALAVLLPPQWFSLLFLLLNYINVFLSRTFFHLLRNRLPLSWRCDKIIKNFSLSFRFAAPKDCHGPSGLAMTVVFDRQV